MTGFEWIAQLFLSILSIPRPRPPEPRPVAVPYPGSCLRACTYTRLVLSKLVAACNLAYIQRTRSVVQVWPDHTCHAHTIIA